MYRYIIKASESLVIWVKSLFMMNRWEVRFTADRNASVPWWSSCLIDVNKDVCVVDNTLDTLQEVHVKYPCD